MSGVKSTSYDVVKAYVSERIGRFSKQEVLVSCPSLGSSSVESALKKLVEDGTLVRIGAGRKTLYARADSVTDFALTTKSCKPHKHRWCTKPYQF